MASGASSQLIVDDEDVFDWTEAVREIDVACGTDTAEEPAAVSSFSSRVSCDQHITEKPVELMHEERLAVARVSSTKQTTLDRFIAVPSSNSIRDRFTGVSLDASKKDVRNGDILDGSLGDNLGKKNIEDVEMLNEFVKIDLEAAKTWIYPVNVPLRDYQFSITTTSLFSNTMVVLPTGLGKTLIAAVVMYNYFRWFPEGKIVFAAPSRPLVMQQIEACHKIVGIPQEWTIDLTGLTSPTRRADLWKNKRVFFVTPQVLEKDIHSGSCSVNQLVCMVIDEAHRAMGNYSYCVAVRELMDNHVQLRILALTATPGYKKQTIQSVIDNLQISSLEYRTESDADVLPYVYDRKIELIEVAMGDAAVEINNLLLEVVRPFLSRLSSLGVLQRRDFETLSPCELINSRDKFRQAPPLNLPQTSCGDIEGYFGVLITLYHIRKLLSSHGITPAFQMLDEKMKQGSFARFMSRNDILLKAMILMEQSISTGVPSPKLTKMLEVLIDHFKVKGQQNSRVIIFSNFRGSVREILSALKSVGEFVKATEFIGQSSGKTTKGQSQKVQQEVLQKFRAGGYNIIVATSIGEEGLDIMEVDLVICFDANVSPLRMIQRMGRTGRQHEGRVVLACEGSELKGYTRKQANSKTIKKYMKNGGKNSFNFHPSPRMVPHVIRPETIFLEMSIEEFVHRGKKVKDDNPLPLPECKTKLTNAEADLLAKYFASSGKIAWRPSLIAFPHFQTFPSRINKLGHSSRTQVLIDSMKYLLGSIFSKDSRTVPSEEEDASGSCLRGEMMEPHDKIVEDSESSDDPAEEKHNARLIKTNTELEKISKDMHCVGFKNTCHNALLFNSEKPTVDAVTNILRLAAAAPSLKLNSECVEGIRTPSSAHDFEDCKENIAPNEGNPHSHSRFQEVEYMLRHTEYDPSGRKLELLSCGKEVFCTPVSNRMHRQLKISGLSCNVLHDKKLMPLADELSNDLPDPDLSPRVTNFIKSGIVPESPINNSGIQNGDLSPRLTNFIKSGIVPESPIYKSGIQNGVAALVSFADLQNQFMRSTENDEKTPESGSFSKIIVPCLGNNYAQMSVSNGNGIAWTASTPPIPVEQQCKYRRIRKIGDVSRKVIVESEEQNNLGRKLSRETEYLTPKEHVKVGKKRDPCAAMFFEEEAEVSLHSATSSDEEDKEDNSSYEDSFICDGSNPISNTQAGVGGPEMMAIYRRSLLSQSPFPTIPFSATKSDPDSAVQSNGIDESRSPSGEKQPHILQTGLESTARNSHHVLCKRTLSRIVSSESRKRKCLQRVESIPILNLEEEFSSAYDIQNTLTQIQMQRAEEYRDIFEDDNFYEGLDLDAVEREAAEVIKNKSKFPTGKTCESPKDVGKRSSPSFDLGVLSPIL